MTRWRSRTSNCAQLNSQPSAPGPRQEVYCTKIGTKRPNEMYIVGAHMDGHGVQPGVERRRFWNRAGDGAGPHLQRTGGSD